MIRIDLKRICSVAVIAMLATPALGEPVTIAVWMHEHPPRLALDEKLVAAFEQANPDINVDLTIFPNAQFEQRLQIGFASGDGPDLFNSGSFNIGQYRHSRLLAPVDLKTVGVDDLNELKAKFGIGIAGAEFDGVAYGLPTEVSNYACVANNALWRTAGLDPAKDAPATWEEMVEVARKLTRRDDGNVPVVRGFDFNWSDPIFMWLTFNAMVNQLGGTVIDEAALTADFDSVQVRTVMDFWSAWANDWALGGPQYTASRDAFLAGELATECTFGSWGRDQFKAAGIDYTFFPVPRWREGTVDTGFNAYAYYMMVNANAPPERQEAAWRFAAFYASQGEALFEEAGLFTTVPAVQELESYTSDGSNTIFTDELDKAVFSPRVPGFNELGDALARARDRIVINHEDASAALGELEAEASTILGRF
ncbi:extracellular solute-binding protein [Sinorhizobium medicae]|uniref:ABC transporter substrate-binding protein n=3 Tax=Sinorhizobium medicae TaxID=110321 RepID=A0A6G1WJ11_9HYPH|nr:extracellular solute-binding protein [Sinorhizobium medicae]ABR60538.1 extracellular solute-binding protein family 1 [Sinorhizobium medicae WSM419]MBO1965142.1 extracellular solute-binding protein [Sinorhizobium medicae]MDX0413167.1 extracellular solute-binding protein [Sinorhizobium medicae]MDX0438093.1 extracellular solute-binding protein [Sinorhizobium medicae]MDX0448924.1 extracellular solute-binding protein [Sinorhizobium medicae]